MRALTIGTTISATRVWMAAACLFVIAVPALAGGGNVLPPTAHAHSYSLANAALATAYFNEGPRTPDTVPSGFPFQILYAPADGSPPPPFDVRTGTMFYVPLVYSDNSDEALWPFPDINDPQAVSDYYFDPAQLGAQILDVVVDGEVTPLGRNYAVGTPAPGLPTGGSSYTVVAAYLGPMTKGTHTVTVRVLLTGAFLIPYLPNGFGFEATYTINVH